MAGDQLKSESAAGDWHPTDDALSTGKDPAVLSTIVARPEPPRSNPAPRVIVDRDALRTALLELHDVRARQGADWRWMDSLHPSLRVELERGMDDPGLVKPTEADLRHQERQLCSAELLILAGRSTDEGTAGVLIEAAVAISRRQVA